MKMKKHKKVNLTSSNLSAEKLAELRRVLPEAFGEDKIDWDKLRAVLGDKIDERIEKFNFSWAGKTGAIQNVLTPSKATLRPAKDEGVKFDTSENLFIEGDNLEVLKLLQKAYFEQVKMIYIDPPYNTGGDFVYRDDFAAPLKSYLQQTGQVDAEGNKLQTNRETSGRYHSDRPSTMYPRLKLAWNLLRDDGVIFVSIDDNELHHLRILMNEIFGEENYIETFSWVKTSTPPGLSNKSRKTVEYILCFEKARNNTQYQGEELAGGDQPLLNAGNKKRVLIFPKDKVLFNLNDGVYRKGMRERVELLDDVTVEAGYPLNNFRLEGEFKWTQGTLDEEIKNGTTFIVKTDKFAVRFIRNGEVGFKAPTNLIKEKFVRPIINKTEAGVGTNEAASSELEEIMGARVFDFPKPVSLIKHLVSLCTQKDDVVMDFFAGAGTTAHAVMEQNAKDKGSRKFVLVQLPELTEPESEVYKMGYKTIADISKERIRRVIKGYGDEPQPTDDGFKVFKLGVSNYAENQFEFDPAKSEDENKRAFEMYLGKTKQTALFGDADELAVVYENIIKEGLSLNSKITEQKIGKNSIYFVDGDKQQLLVCLDKKIDDKTVSELTGGSYKGKTFICLDNALDDTSKANLGLNVELKTI